MYTVIGCIFIVVAILGLSIYVYLVWNFNLWKKRGIKGPKPMPLVGNISGMLTYSHHITYDLHNIYCLYKGSERFVGYFMAKKPRLMILDPKLIREVLITNFKHFQDNDSFFLLDQVADRLIAQNPFFLSGTEWKEKRTEITPALTISRIKASYPIMIEVCKKMWNYLEQLFENPPKDGIEAKDFAARYTIEVVANCLFGLDAGAFSEGECALREETTKIFDSNGVFGIFFTSMVSTFPFVKKFVNVSLVSKRTEQFFTNLMNDAIKYREQSKGERIDYLLQLRDKKNLSPVDMAAHTLTFLLDGFETSSVLISHCIHITHETLRLFPPATFLSKVCTESRDLEDFQGRLFGVEKGDIVVLPIYSIQRDEEYYENGNAFFPERFSPENGGIKKYKDLGMFFPFGDGPRQCLGMKFALAQSKAAIAELVSNWEMSLNSKTKPDFRADPKNFLFVMDGGIWIDFKKYRKR